MVLRKNFFREFQWVAQWVEDPELSFLWFGFDLSGLGTSACCRHGQKKKKKKIKGIHLLMRNCHCKVVIASHYLWHGWI